MPPIAQIEQTMCGCIHKPPGAHLATNPWEHAVAGAHLATKPWQHTVAPATPVQIHQGPPRAYDTFLQGLSSQTNVMPALESGFKWLCQNDW